MHSGGGLQSIPLQKGTAMSQTTRESKRRLKVVPRNNFNDSKTRDYSPGSRMLAVKVIFWSLVLLVPGAYLGYWAYCVWGFGQLGPVVSDETRRFVWITLGASLVLIGVPFASVTFLVYRWKLQAQGRLKPKEGDQSRAA
jgi:hypothetical protein